MVTGDGDLVLDAGGQGRRPDPAVINPDGSSWTYDELLERAGDASRVARPPCGAVPGEPVVAFVAGHADVVRAGGGGGHVDAAAGAH